MPSKSNKKKAAAERSARLAAEAGAEVPAQEVDVPVVAPTTAAPASVAALAPQMASLAVSTPSSAPSSSCASKKATTFELPKKLEPLQKFKPLKVITNSFLMDIKPVTCYRFDVSVQGQQDDDQPFELAGQRGGNRNRQADLAEIVAAAFKQEGLGNFIYLYDGAATLYTTRKLISTKNGSIGSIHTTIDASFSENIQKSTFDRGAHGRFHVSIEPNTAQPTLLTTDVLNESLNLTSCPLTQMMQIAVAEYAKQNGFLVTDGGKELFNKNGARTTKGIDEMLGVGASVKIVTGETARGAAHIIVDYKKKKFFTAGPLSNLLEINWNAYSKAGQYVKGIHLGTLYSRQTIEAIGVSNQPMIDIEYPGGTVLGTAAEKMNKKPSAFNPSWPAVQARLGRKVISFAIETLRVLPNQKLTPKQGNPPKCEGIQRRFELMNEVGKMAYILSPNPILAEFGVNIVNTPISIEAVTIPPPMILYNGFTTSPNVSNGAKWNVPNVERNTSGKFVVKATIPKMLLLFNSDSYAEETKMVNLKSSLERTSRDLGVAIKEIRIENLYNTYGNMSDVDALEAKYKTLQKSMTYVIYADYSHQPTHELLKLLERLYEVPTQHVTFDKALLKPGRSTMINFMLKINSKSLGLNHKVAADPMIEHIWGDKSNTLIISYDVCHSSGRVYTKGEKCSEPSCVGFGFNGTSIPDAFIGDFHYQLPRHEQVDAKLLTMRAKMMTNTYIANRKKLPENVIILRDGVSEGQNAMVRLEEFPAIKDGVMEAVTETARQNGLGAKKPKFAILIVLKGNAHRFFLKNEQGIFNVPPLTVTDRVIVKKNGSEMVMVCHHPLHGSAQPVLINILLNEDIFRRNDEIARLMAAMCCAHQVSTTITSVPEPITAADDYAKRGADLFTILNKRHPEEVPRKEDEEGIPQIDFLELTKKLSYVGSAFKLRRMA